MVGTLYPLILRATYPTLGFPQYPGETATSEADDEVKAKSARDAANAIAGPLEAIHTHFLDGRSHRRRFALDRRHPPRCVSRVPAHNRLRLPGLAEEYMSAVESALGDAYSARRLTSVR